MATARAALPNDCIDRSSNERAVSRPGRFRAAQDFFVGWKLESREGGARHRWIHESGLAREFFSRRKLSIGVTASLTPALAGWVGALCRPSAKNACCFIPRGVSSHSDRALLTSDRSGLSGHSGRYALNTVFGSTTQIPVGLRNLRAWWVGGRPSCDARRHPDRARV